MDFCPLESTSGRHNTDFNLHIKLIWLMCPQTVVRSDISKATRKINSKSSIHSLAHVSTNSREKCLVL